MMKRLLTVALLLLTVPLVAAAQNSDIEQQLRKIVTEMVGAHARGDRAVFERYLADDYIGTTMNGVPWTKADVLKHLPSASATMKITLPEPPQEGVTFNMKDVKLHVFGDTVVMTYQFDYQTKVDRTPNLVSFRSTDVFTKGTGGWQLRVHQRTLLPATKENVDWVFKMDP